VLPTAFVRFDGAKQRAGDFRVENAAEGERSDDTDASQ